MNTLKIFTLLFIGSFALHAQDLRKSEVPSEVVTSFEKNYPDAYDVEWEKHWTGYSVDFEQDRMDREIRYNDSWEIVRTETELMRRDLPAAIRKGIENNYAGFRVENAEKEEEKGVTTYLIELENMGKEKEVRFDKSGKVLKEWND